MSLIEFQDYPSTETPLNAEILNQLQVNIENALYYKNGDTYIINGSLASNGYVTGGAMELNIPITVPKSLSKIKSVTVSNYKLNARNVQGTYIVQNLTDALMTAYIRSENILMLSIKNKDGSAFNVQNNTPISAQIYNMTFTFKE